MGNDWVHDGLSGRPANWGAQVVVHVDHLIPVEHPHKHLIFDRQLVGATAREERVVEVVAVETVLVEQFPRVGVTAKGLGRFRHSRDDHDQAA